ncbi:SDR family NAD(P)-dependent oxidoreductase [Sorangium sp. So ce1335]|uniref:SDR family NAD(P)-dependent oxidoreductase n=1 Tax=Sorangium sp. So ce1335 TaxID=3133335 RepID=UPI003F5DCEC3
MSNRIDRVIITGASSGIGLDLARRFLAEGSRLVLNGRDPEKLDRARRSLEGGERVVAVPGHVGDRATARAVVDAARERFGGVDVLINNAGIFGVKPFLESTEEDLERFFSTNVKGTFLMTQAAVPLMIEGGGGSILNVGTVLVQQAMTGMPCSAAMASKGGVHALTVSLAAELARHNIRVNTLAPGIIRTPLIGENADAMASIHPLGRIGEVRDTTDAALYLARAGFVTGTTLDVDGGYAHGR